ncbi:hypothetical protein BBJ28_00000718 [Nothophytophthora sp. Chile5]|nr:hypothetical protein BBJ28_00000718 [Nothophytophthora sp. Chile5]
MKAVFTFTAFTAIAAVHAADCDVAALSAVAATSDASTCQSASTFAVPVNSTEGSILTSYDAFCASEACLEVLEALDAITECTIDGTALHESIVHPIEDACSASTAASGHESHESSMADMEMEDSHEAMSQCSDCAAHSFSHALSFSNSPRVEHLHRPPLSPNSPRTMKLSFASLAVVGAALSGLVTAEECALDHLQMILSDANLATCTSDSGLSLATASSFTTDQVMKVCASSACMALVADVKAMNLGDCTFPNSTIALQTGLLDPITAVCGSSGSMGSGSMEMSSSGDTSVGDSSTVGSTAADNTVGGSGSTSTSSAMTLTVGAVSAIAMAAVTALL